MWKRWTVGTQDGLQSLPQEKGEVSVSEGIIDRQLHTFPISGDSWMKRKASSLLSITYIRFLQPLETKDHVLIKC